MTKNTDLKAAAALIAMGAAFGASFMFMKVLTDEISTFEIVAGRLVLAALVLAAVILVRGVPFNLTPRGIVQIGTLAVFDGIIPFSLVAWAETRIDAGIASLLISTMPVFTVIFAMVALPDERRAPVRLLAVPLGIGGVLVLSGGSVVSLGDGDAIGQLAVVVAACSYGLSGVYTKMLLRTNDPINLTGTKLAIGAAVASTLMVVTDGTPSYATLSAEGWLSLAGIGFLATAGAFTVYIWLVGRAGSVYSSMVTYVTPVFGVFLGWAILGESLGPETAAGAVLIATAVATVMFGPRLVERWQQRSNRPGLIEIRVPQTAQVICREGQA
jgi:drug/metabolite transporter (DMT)-like permease